MITDHDPGDEHVRDAPASHDVVICWQPSARQMAEWERYVRAELDKHTNSYAPQGTAPVTLGGQA